jgi:hypothetical protein
MGDNGRPTLVARRNDENPILPDGAGTDMFGRPPCLEVCYGRESYGVAMHEELPYPPQSGISNVAARPRWSDA